MDWDNVEWVDTFLSDFSGTDLEEKRPVASQRQICALIDLRYEPQNERSVSIAATTRYGVVRMLVDEIMHFGQLDDPEVDPADNVSFELREYVLGMVRYQDRRAMLLNVDRLVTRLTFSNYNDRKAKWLCN